MESLPGGKLNKGDADPDQRRAVADLMLLSVAVIWGSAFSAQRVASAHVGPFTYNGSRFLLAAAVLMLVLRGRWRSIRRIEWRGGLLAGLILAAASTLQQAGIAFTTAGKAGFITGLYVVLVPLFVALVWRQGPTLLAWAASVVATAGLYLLSVEGRWALQVGDALELGGAVLWALHVIVVGQWVKHADPLRLSSVQYLVCGVVNTILGALFERDTLTGLYPAWWTVLYGGAISVGLGYTLQAYGQRGAPATDAAVILSMEAVFAALFGWLVLDERLTTVQVVGCALMLGGMLLAQASSRARPSEVQPVLDIGAVGDDGGRR
jgi:drug/metabolite transporter (DMT)-like permease